MGDRRAIWPIDSRSASRRNSRSSIRHMGAALPRDRVDGLGTPLGDQIKREMHQSIVEVGTRDLRQRRRAARRDRPNPRASWPAAERVGLRRGGRHASLLELGGSVISPGERYETSSRSCSSSRGRCSSSACTCTSGCPIAHDDRPDERGALLPAAPARALHQLAVLGWARHGPEVVPDTVFRRFPRTGIPDHFGSWSEYENYVKLLVDLRCIDDAKKIWWDVRPHPTFGTLEFRICDVPTRVEETIALAALIQAIVVKLYRSTAEHGLPALPPRAHRGEQVARRALGDRRQADRLRQARRSADARSGARAPRVRRRRGGRAGSRDAVEYMRTILREARAPIGSCAYTGRPATSGRSSSTSSTKPARGARDEPRVPVLTTGAQHENRLHLSAANTAFRPRSSTA